MPSEKQIKYYKSIKGIKLSEEHKRKISDAMKGKMPKNIKIIAGWNKGILMSKEQKKNFKTGKNHCCWKGKNVAYRALHLWINKYFGKPAKCEHCGKEGLVNTKKNLVINWANKDHKYRRVKEDWIRLCRHCHRIYDLRMKI